MPFGPKVLAMDVKAGEQNSNILAPFVDYSGFSIRVEFCFAAIPIHALYLANGNGQCEWV